MRRVSGAFPFPRAGEGQGEGVSGRSSRQRRSLTLALSQREREKAQKGWPTPDLLYCHSEQSEESFDDAQDRSGCVRPFAEFILNEAGGLRVTGMKVFEIPSNSEQRQFC